MPEIKLKARIQNKYETLDEWNKLTKGEFIPLKGEVCYGIKEDMLYKKIGDGQTDFIDLPWLLNQADNEVNDETSPAYIKNRLAYPEHTEVPEAEQLLYEGYFEVNEFIEGQYTLTPTDIATMFNNSDIINLFKENQTLMAATSDIAFEDSREDLFNKLNKIQFNYTNSELKVDFYKNAKELNLLGYQVVCQGNTNWANVVLNLIFAGEDVYTEFFPYDEQQTDNFCIVNLGPVIDDEEIGFEFNCMLIDPTSYAPTYVDEESTDDSGNPIIISYPVYPFKLEILSYGQMHVIEDKYLGDVKSDFEELSSNSRTYIKNRPGINTIVELTDSYIESLGKYNSTITAGPYDSTVLGQTLRGENVHEDFASPDLMHMLESCTVTIDGETWHNCPVFQRTIVGSSDQRNAYYIGNPIHIANNTNKWLDLLKLADPENTMIKGYKFYEELDNGLPFLIPYCPNSDSPLYDGGAYKFPKRYDNKEKFGITIVPEKMRLTTNIIRKDLLPQETVIGYLNNELNSILLNSSYEASGANSLAAGHGTKATASEAIALGDRTEANGINSLSMGQENKAEGKNSFVTGLTTQADGDQSVALGEGSIASGDNSISAGGHITNSYSNITVRDNGNVLITNLSDIGYNQIRLYYKPDDNSTERYTPWFKIYNIYTTEQENVYRVNFDGFLSEYNKDFSQFRAVQIRKTNYTQEDNSFVFGVANRTNGIGSAAFGYNNTAKNAYSFVIGKNNEIGNEAFIIGNGASNDNRSNAMKIDWNGDTTFAGSVEATSIILTSPNGTKFKITVNDEGTLTSTKVN